MKKYWKTITVIILIILPALCPATGRAQAKATKKVMHVTKLPPQPKLKKGASGMTAKHNKDAGLPKNQHTPLQLTTPSKKARAPIARKKKDTLHGPLSPKAIPMPAALKYNGKGSKRFINQQPLPPKSHPSKNLKNTHKTSGS